VPSVTPDNETGIIDETTLESLIGLSETEVIERIGQPDFSGPRGLSYMMVYQGEKIYSTDIYVGGVGAMGPIPFPYAGKADTTYTNVFHCFVMELNQNHVVQGYNVVDNTPRGTRRDSTDEQVTPIANCAEAVWEPEERNEILAMRAAADREARIAELEAQAEQGNTDAAVELAELTGNLAPLRTLAEKGDRDSAIELARLTGETTGTLRALAENGDRAAAIFLARLQKESGPLIFLAEKGDYEAAHILAAEFDDYSYLTRLAKEGDYVVAYEQYLNFRNTGEPSEFSAAWNWLCSAANAGYSKAQAEVGFRHRSSSWDAWRGWNENGLELLRKVGVRPDDRIAYMWYTLAVSTGDRSTRNARDYYVAKLLTNVEISQAEQMARDWKPGDCPSEEHRFGVPGGT
jgi:TPR repeat protein